MLMHPAFLTHPNTQTWSKECSCSAPLFATILLNSNNVWPYTGSHCCTHQNCPELRPVSSLQVQFQLQQAMGSSGGLAVIPTGLSGPKSPTRRSPTKHKPFHLSDSPWKRDSTQLGQSGKAPLAAAQAASQAASPRRGRSASKSPIRTARSQKVAASLEKQPMSSKGRPKGATSGTRQAERQPERQTSSPANGQGGAAGVGSPGLMSFGTYGGVAFSSFTPEVPSGLSGMADDDEDGESLAGISFSCNTTLSTMSSLTDLH